MEESQQSCGCKSALGLVGCSVQMLSLRDHVQVEKEKRRAAAKAAAEYEQAKKSQGWVSWMMGGPPKPSTDSTELRADLSSEEFQKLEEIVSEQEKAVQQGTALHQQPPTQDCSLKGLAVLLAEVLAGACPCKCHKLHCDCCNPSKCISRAMTGHS